jgi:hypothetical protein
MSSVSKSSGARKKEARERRVLAKSRREERAGQHASKRNRRAGTHIGVGFDDEAPLDKTPVTFEKHELERIDRMLQFAAHSALEAAPRDIPPLLGRTGAAAAIDAYREINMIRNLLAKAEDDAS